ncbi:MAG TPA: competence/damage-inducible protein A [Acidobacteriaceae bacterium]|nr:competence/damage-inducible protein A [Acidobacteriaceae bacterium]
MIAEIVAAGSEMLGPYRQDTNSLWLTERLNELGVSVAFKTIVGDNLEHLIGAAKIAVGRVDVVIFSGGLGPTEDDKTREAVAAALGLGLRRDNDLLTGIYKRFAARRMAMPQNNAKQADVLEGAEVLANAQGSAPGQFLDTVVGRHRKIVILLPGPPKELKAMYEDTVWGRLEGALPVRHMAKRMLRMALIPESEVDARTAPIYGQYEDVETTILAGSGEIQLHFVCVKRTEEEAQARVDELAEKIEAEMGEAVFSSDGETLEEVVLLMLGLRHMTLAAAESCTGGLLAQRLTAVPGSSRYFLGGAVVYADRLKTEFADVEEELIEREGPVSEAVARALAEGIRRRTGATVGVGITGIAGPGLGTGADEGKPVGLVYVGLSFEDDGGVGKVMELNLSGDRERIRFWATQHALEMLRRSLLERV